MRPARPVPGVTQTPTWAHMLDAVLEDAQDSLDDVDQSLASKQLAFDVLQDTDKYTLRFARWYLLHPVADNVTDVSEISDQNVMDNIPTLWDFALPPEQP